MTDDHDRMCKELDDALTKVHIAENKVHLKRFSKQASEQDSSKDSDEVKNLIEQLNTEIQQIKCHNENKCNASWDGDCPMEYWDDKYHNLWNEQGDYENGLLDGLLNNGDYQKEIERLNKVKD